MSISKKSRCYTCLSLDRNLKPIKTEGKNILCVLCPEMFFHNKHNIQYLYLMCWECEYMIAKIKRFQAKVSKAQAQLKLTLQGVIVDGLSNMKITGIETIDVPPWVPQIIPTDQDQPTLEEIPQLLPLTVTPLKVDPEIIKIVEDEEEKCFSGDYDELIPPTKIQQASGGESTDTASESGMYDDTLKEDVPTQIATKHAIVAPSVKHRPKKVIIDVPQKRLALRGFRKPANVTRGFPNLVTDETVPILIKKQASVPTLRKTKDGITIVVADKDGASIVKSDKRSVTNLVKERVVPTILKRKEPVLKRIIIPINPDPPKEPQPKEPPPRKPECEQRAGIYGYQEPEVKCIILNETGLSIYRDKRRSTRGYKGHPYKCDRCIQKFWDEKFLVLHNVKHDESYGPSMCKVCEQRFPSKYVRDEHYKQHFILYECLKCQYQDNELEKVNIHIRRVHEVSVFYCKKCDAVFKTYREKRRHTLTVHTTRKKITCEVCGKIFPSMARLNLHARIHQRQKTDCPVCKKKIRNNFLETHMKIHDDTCDHCNKYFQNKRTLKEHLEEINGIKYTCDICKKVLKSKIKLAKHIRFIHEGKKYQRKPKILVCDYCGKSYNCKLSLMGHINNHLGLRPYVCKDCGATFAYPGPLFTHRRLVHKVKRKYEMPT